MSAPTRPMVVSSPASPNRLPLVPSSATTTSCTGGVAARLAEKTAVESRAGASAGALPRGVAQLGQNLNPASAMAAPHFGQVMAPFGACAASLAPQKEQNGSVVSTSWPHTLHFGAWPGAGCVPDA